ncbi:MAG: D-aminoacyl-tRNA deacylase [Dehalococcoidia bacterium]|nr:D-aminoacyl-tRNA deacylase [Chloroflexota bacterium]
MRALLQRVSRASVSVDGQIIGKVGPGLVAFIGVEIGDTETDARYVAEKTASLRIFSDETSKFNLSALDTGGEILVVSQFTLLADTRKGRRPSFTEAAPPEKAQVLIESFVHFIRSTGLRVETGQFQKHMLVEIHNDGPVTILISSKR